jgi:hypothetical protein
MIWAILVLLTTNLFAANCSLYELQGDVDLESRVSLTVNKGLKSQKVFHFADDIRFEMGPYIKKTVRGSFVTKDFEIQKIEKVKAVVPDPLHHFQEMVFLKKVPCPVAKKKGP